MKSYLSLFLLVLLAFANSCNPGYTCDENRYEVIGVETVQLVKIDSNSVLVPLINDTIKSKELGFKLNFNIQKLSLRHFTLINSSYAEGCPPRFVDWALDSIKVYSITNSVTQDITLHIGTDIHYSKGVTSPTFYNELNSQIQMSQLFFYLRSPLDLSDTYQFRFHFYDKKGREFIIKSKSIFVK